ncbi:MAG: helix-turn-helix transcriptional regulator [Treponema sp.]|nr:helix-turn-helix transcriptional regulator [Treponema sp.]
MVIPAGLFGQAGRTDGINSYYYADLYEAFEDVINLTYSNSGINMSMENPVEITVLADVTLNEPLIVPDNVHIRLVAGGAVRTIHRGDRLLEYPCLWVNGINASLSLGRPGMEYELVIDGGCFNITPIFAGAPIAAVNGPDSKLIMYDNVILQNNHNNGEVLPTSPYQNGSGVIVRTQSTDFAGDASMHTAEFIMKGGIIRGNTLDTISPISSGGGVCISGFGVFTMEGGIISGNSARISGGGVSVGSRGSFYKTGGIIYGSDAPEGQRNTSLEGTAAPKSYGHAVIVHIFEPPFKYRNDTVKENDNLGYTGAASGNGIFNSGDKWDDPDKAAQRRLLIIILSVLVICIIVFFIIRHLIKKEKIKMANTAEAAPEVDLEDFDLSSREKEICRLLLTELSMKQIAYKLGITYSGAAYHSQNLYRKLNIKTRTELFVKFGRKAITAEN